MSNLLSDIIKRITMIQWEAVLGLQCDLIVDQVYNS